MARVILDSGAVIALAAGQARARQFVERALQRRDVLVVPSVVIAETTRGGPRDAGVNRVLKSVHNVAPVTERSAREAGRLLSALGLSNATVDALVVAEASRQEPAVILTSDMRDISALAAGYAHVRVFGV